MLFVCTGTHVLNVWSSAVLMEFQLFALSCFGFDNDDDYDEWIIFSKCFLQLWKYSMVLLAHTKLKQLFFPLQSTFNVARMCNEKIWNENRTISSTERSTKCKNLHKSHVSGRLWPSPCMRFQLNKFVRQCVQCTSIYRLYFSKWLI